jgi:glycosyltransferase involved in cell wall biosynthesis
VVLTSTQGCPRERTEEHILRWLTYRPAAGEGGWLDLARRVAHDLSRFRRAVTAVAPQVICVFSLYGLPHALLPAARRTGRPVVYAFSGEWLEPAGRGDPWLSRWSTAPSARGRRLAKRALGRLLDGWLPTDIGPLDLRHAYFTSAGLRANFEAKGFPVAEAEVIHWGVDVQRFRYGPGDRRDGLLRLLFAGRIAPEKGLHTAIEALEILRELDDPPALVLDVAGPVQAAGYLRDLKRAIAERGLGDIVRFLGTIPWEAMPDLYRGHDVYLLPSVWAEPFSIGLLEAMASRLAVVGTTTGGSREVLNDGVNCLTFPPEDARVLALQLRRVLDPGLRERIAAAGRATVEAGFTFDRMLRRIESLLGQSAGERRHLS